MSAHFKKINFHGRRQLRPLSAEKKAIYDDKLPQLKATLHNDFWTTDKPLGLEIGFGGGEHLAQVASQNPDKQFIGAEPFINGVASIIKHIETNNLSNIWVWDDDIHLLLSRIPVPAVFDSVHLLFADPWPKKRHSKRRFLQNDTIKRIHDLLKPNACWYIATDHVAYREWILEHFDAHKHLFTQIRSDIFERPSINEWPQTRYEEKALKEGRNNSYMIYKKIE